MSNSSGRSRALTEKGRLYKLGLFQEKRCKLGNDIRREICIMEELMQNDSSRETLIQQQQVLNGIFEEFMTAHGTCQMLIQDEERNDEDDVMVDNLDRTVFSIKRRVRVILSNKESHQSATSTEKKAIKNESRTFSRRTPSITTSRSKKSTQSLELKAKEEMARLEELKVEASFLRRRQETEFAAKQLEVELEMAKASAKLKIFKDNSQLDEVDSIPEFRPNVLHQAEKTEKQTSLQYTQEYIDSLQSCFNPVNQNERTFEKEFAELKPDKERNDIFSCTVTKDVIHPTPQVQSHTLAPEALDNTLIDKAPSIDPLGQLTNMFQYLQAPEVDIDIFRGDPLEFLYFITSFEEVVEKKIRDQRGCLTRLLKYLEGEPKDLISSCIYLPTMECYKEAKRLLKQRYGDPYRIVSEYRKSLKQWPKLKANDSAGFRKFQTFLTKFSATMKYSGNESHDNPETIQLLHSKLPIYLQDRWNRESMKIRKKTSTESKLHHFINWLDIEVDLATDPLYSREATSESTLTGDKNPNRSKRISTLLSNISNSPLCPMCNSNHDLERCIKYLELTIDERRRFIFKSHLCFCCLEPTSDEHSAKNCKKRRKCDVCKKEHPTSLHGYQTKTSKELSEKGKVDKAVVSHCTKLEFQVVSLSVVPVKLFHPKSSKSIVVNALLDNGSQGCFIREDILQAMEVPSTPTSLTIKTITGEENAKCLAVKDLRITSASIPSQVLTLPKTYSRKTLPVDKDEIPTSSKVKKWTYLDKIQRYLPKDDDGTIGLLIGGNCPKALEPLQTIPAQNGGPYACRTILGWCVTGPITSQSISKKEFCSALSVHRIGFKPLQLSLESNKVKDMSIKEMILKMMNMEFSDSRSNDAMSSQEDQMFMKLMDKEVKFIDGHYQLPLPLRDVANMPNNRGQAVRRAMWLKQKLTKQPEIHSQYTEFMNSIINRGYARKIESSDPTPKKGQVWYLPHHGVIHARKNKIRVVFDCSAQKDGVSLNTQLMQGPDLTNQLIGVLMRFRKDKIAMVADIEQMFYQVTVSKSQRNLLRFLWWNEGNLDGPLHEYQMCVHLFGASSSPSCSNYALRKTAEDNKQEFGEEAHDTLINNFYVDDMLQSTGDESSAINLYANVKGMCASGGFNLTKFLSNSRKVLQVIPDHDRATGFCNLDLSKNSLPLERALGICWCVENDSFQFRITLKDTPLSRRGILASISSIYDPLGLIAPVTLIGKKLLQQLCIDNSSWDDDVSDEHRMVWQKWRNSLVTLESLSIRRCFKPDNFAEVKEVTMHHFSDASSTGYGEASYIRLLDVKGNVQTSLVMAKSRVTPTKSITIPRLELSAATVSANVSRVINREINFSIKKHFFWTDSQVVLGYIKNVTKRFHVFVANRIQVIHDASNRNDWHYIESSQNPADDCSRGLSAKKFLESGRWFSGPDFLLKAEPFDRIFKFSVDDNDPEVRKPPMGNIKVHTSIISGDLLSLILERTRSWIKLNRIVATMLKWKYGRKIDVELLRKAEIAIIRLLHSTVFKDEVEQITKQSNTTLKKSSPLHKLQPFLDENQLLRVGGRLQNSNLPRNIKHPLILPKNNPLTESIIQWCHTMVKHSGRGMTLNELQQRGFMVINGNSRVRYVISKCVVCRRLRGKFGEQQMASLPEDRFEEAPPFTYAAVDMFGPFVIKERRKELKRYGALFTCMASRAVHIEVTSSLEADSFILALRRFISRRGPVRQLRSDNGTNFTGADAELVRAIHEMDNKKVEEFLLTMGTDWMSWKFNTPTASHMGGVWERQIRTARSILASLLLTHGHSLNEESFRTLITEVEAVINSRPLSVEVSDSLTPITPNSLLTMKSKIVMPPPGAFSEVDVYSRRRWRRIQHILNEFWLRWRHSYLQALQQRQKWISPRRNFEIDDVVLLKDESPRNNWQLARIVAVESDGDGYVRTVSVRTSTRKEFRRPINKLVLLLECSKDKRFPVKEP